MHRKQVEKNIHSTNLNCVTFSPCITRENIHPPPSTPFLTSSTFKLTLILFNSLHTLSPYFSLHPSGSHTPFSSVKHTLSHHVRTLFLLHYFPSHARMHTVTSEASTFIFNINCRKTMYHKECNFLLQHNLRGTKRFEETKNHRTK